MMAMPRVMTVIAVRVQIVERTDRILIHSAPITLETR